MLRYKGYYASVEFDEDGGVLHGEVMNTRDVITFQADTAANVVSEFHASVDDYLDFCAKRAERPEKPLSGKFLVRATPELHKRLHFAASAAGMSLNSWLLKTLDESTKEDA
jgi:predicted HicB family RNase H-like nuclease